MTGLAVLAGCAALAAPSQAQYCTAPSFFTSTLPAGAFPRSVAFGDFNGDGSLDVAAANDFSNDVSVLLSTGFGSFQVGASYPVGSSPSQINAADFNRDGRTDLVVLNAGSDNLSILLGNGDGTFQAAVNYTTGAAPESVAVADLNGDGILDLLVANDNANTVVSLRGNGNGTFQPAVVAAGGLVQPTAVVVGDFNRDGKLDLAASNLGSPNVTIALGNGNGTFQPPQALTITDQTQALHVLVADVNKDAKADLVAFDVYGPRVMLGRGDGTFAAPIASSAFLPFAAAAADVDGDGELDLIVKDEILVWVLRGVGDGSFRPPVSFGVPGDTGAPYLGQSVAIGDVNRDGRPDFAVATLTGNTVALFYNTFGRVCPGLSFADPVAYGSFSFSVEAASIDFNRDGNTDLAVLNYGGNNVSLLRGNGQGGFVSAGGYAVGTTPYAVTVVDFNGDGRKDLAVANLGSNDVSILLGNANGTFQAAVSYAAGTQPAALAAGDFNRDGRPDLAVANFGSGNVSILLGNGNGTFQPAVNYATGAGAARVAVGDFNRDGRPDLVVPNFGQGTVSILLGNGNGTFQPAVSYFAGLGPSPVAVGDFDRDGRLDLAIGNNSANTIAILKGSGDGTFPTVLTYPTGIQPQFLVAVDLNADGALDLAVANAGSNAVAIFPGNGDGTFGAPTTIPVSTRPTGIAVGDFDKDGKPDLAVANSNGPAPNTPSFVSVLLNTNCKPRRLQVQTDVSSCNTPGAAFAAQPVLALLDDGGNSLTCDDGLVWATVHPGTGALGAQLGGASAVAVQEGLATFADLSVDLAGRGYVLDFQHSAGLTTSSRTFTQGLKPPLINGPAAVGVGASPGYSVDAGYDSASWLLDGTPAGTTQTVNPTFTTAGTHALRVDVTQDGCGPVSRTLDIGAIAPQLSIDDVQVGEGQAGGALFTVSLSAPPAIPLGTTSVSFATSDGSASAAAGDYVATAGSLSFPPGVTARTVSVPVPADAAPDSTRDFFVLLGGAQNGVLARSRGEAWILDPSASQRLQFSAPSYAADETRATVLVTVTRTGPPTGTVSVQYSSSEGTAAAGVRYTAVSGTLTFAPGITSQSFKLPILNDANVEGPQTVLLALSSPSGRAALGTPSTAVVTIRDDDVGEAVQFGAATYVSPQGGKATVVVTRTGPTSLPVGVHYATSAGTAQPGVNYNDVSGDLSFAPGIKTRTFSVPLLKETLDQGDRTVLLSLSNASGAALGSPSTAVLVIQDKDTAGALQFSVAAYVAKVDGGGASITVMRNGAAAGVTVGYATADGTASAAAGDYLPVAGTLSFAAGVATQSFVVPIANNGPKGDQTVKLLLSSPTGGATLGARATALLTIQSPTTELQFSAAAYSVSETGGQATITVTRGGPTTGAVSVDYATSDGSALAGRDYLPASGTLSFAPGVKSRTFVVTVSDAALLEPSLTLNLALSNPQPPGGAFLGARAQSTLTLLTDAPSVQFSSAQYSVAEAGKNATVTVRRSGPTKTALSVDYNTADGSAAAGLDYTASSGRLAFGLGVVAQSFKVPILNDVVHEGGETVLLSLGNSNGALLGSPASAVLTIGDNDAAGTLQFAAAHFSVSETGPQAAITVTRSGGTAAGVEVSYATADGSALAGLHYLPASGVLSFAEGETSKTFLVTVLDDGVASGNKTVALTLSNPGGGAVLGGAGATLWIVDRQH
jgi:hypothetical protein